jgi:hypothetical protein
MTDALKRRLALLTLIGVILLAPIFWLVYRPVGGWSDLHGYVLGRDFINMWVGPKVAESFGTGVLFDLGAYHKAMSMILGTDVPFHNWSYPPDVLLFAWPFSALPYALALGAWTVLGLAVFSQPSLPVCRAQIAAGACCSLRSRRPRWSISSAGRTGSTLLR